MNNTVQQFLNDVFGEVRALNDKNGNIWFMANDVLSILEYAKNGWATKINRLNKNGVTKCKVIDNMGRNQEANFINEPNLYVLIFGSKMNKAQEFQDWICTHVIPSLRKDGAYIDGEEKVVTGELDETEFILKAMTMLQGKVDRLTKERDEYKEEVDQFTNTENLLSWDTVAKNLTIGKNTMLKKLRELKILQTDEYEYKGKKYKGESHNVPYQNFMKYFDVKYNVKDGKRYPKVLITAKGQEYLYKKLVKEAA